MARSVVAWTVTLALAWTAGRASAQGGAPGSGESPLGDSPGSGGRALGTGPGEGTVGGGAGPGFPRVAPGMMRPGGTAEPPGARGIGAVPEVPRAELPLYGRLEIPTGPEEEGPAGGLTLDQAIERLVRTNLDLQAKAIEIPKAQAEILTAGLRNNPLLFADAQLVPYGGFPADRPGGPTQYDINVTFPVDVAHKRRARLLVACRARRVVEAQFQDAVRQTIDNLYTAWVDVLAARETVRFAEASVGRESSPGKAGTPEDDATGLNRLLNLMEARAKSGDVVRAEVQAIRIQRDTARIGLEDARATLGEARRSLGVLLNVPPGEVESLEIRGSLRDASPPPPPADELVGIALAARPDLAAYRLGVRRAEAEVVLAHSNRVENPTVFYQPFTLQDNPAPLKDSASWAVGATVPLPIFNRNQGNIQRARLSVTQTRVQLAELERRVVAEVQRQARAYEVSREALGRFELNSECDPEKEQGILCAAREALETSRQRFPGDIGLSDFLEAQRAYNEVVRQYRDVLVQHRRAMLQLNTAVGQRVLP